MIATALNIRSDTTSLCHPGCYQYYNSDIEPSCSSDPHQAFQSFQILAGLFFDRFPKHFALFCFGLSSFGFAMTCGLFISISVTRIFIIVKVKHSWIFWMRIFGFKYIRIQQWGRRNKSEWPTLLFTARSLPQLEPHEGLLFWILWSGTPFSCLHLCSSCPLPRQGYGWAGNKNEMLIP